MLERYRGFLLDIDGVLVRGGQALPGAAEALDLLRARGRVLLLTNNSTRSRAGTAERLRRAGIPAAPEEVLPSSYVAAQFLRGRYGPVRYWCLGEEGIREEMGAAGHVLVPPEEAEWIVVGMDRELTYGKLAQALRALLRGARLLATNEDPTFPTPEGLVPGAGAIVGALRGMGFPPEVVVGKPSPIAFQVALELLGLPPQAVLMIGDRLDTDIAGAQALGLDTALVLSGVTRPADLERAGIRPTYVAQDLRCLAQEGLLGPLESGAMEVLIRSPRMGEVRAVLEEGRAPKTVAALRRALPLKAVARRWGQEVYFATPVAVELEGGAEVVEKGAIGYWPPGRALCLFFGPTPASRNPQEIRPASPVTVVGRVLGDPAALDRIQDGDPIEVLPA